MSYDLTKIRRTSVVRIIGPLLFLLAGCSQASAGTVDITLIPSSNIRGLPGDTVGWGFTITNNTAGWLFFTGSSLTESNVIGTYTDFFSNNSGNDLSGALALVDPNTSWGPVAFDNTSSAGVGSYLIDPGTSLFADDNGTITITYASFDCNPNICSPTETDTSLTASFDIFVATPEPSAAVPLALIAVVWAVFALHRRRRFVR